MDKKTVKSAKILGILFFALIVVIVIILSSSALVSAYNLVCLKKGETMKFSECNPLMKNYYCNSDMFCSYCVFVGSKGKYCPAMINKCNALGLSCTSSGSNTTIDKTPPVIGVCSLCIDNSIYSSSKQLIKLGANEPSVWYYKNFADDSWKKLCDRSTTCLKSVSFDEGPNHIVIRAVDKAGNEAKIERRFRIDSEKPKIYRTYPKDGFSNGDFSVEFKEQNPKSLILYYGLKNKSVDLTKCYPKGTKTACDVNADVSSYDGQTIPYWFELTDVADSKAVSKKIYLKVDNSAPEILNPTSFWTQGIGKSSKYISFSINLKEPNLDSIEYKDTIGGSKSSWKTLCSSLRNGKCEKKVTFSKKGHHVVDIQLTDEAGNSIAKSIEFDVI